MDINEKYNSIITAKIKYDDSNRFNLLELKEFSDLLNISIEELTFGVLGVNKKSFQDLKNEKQKNVVSKEYSYRKKQYILDKSDEILEKIVKEKIKTDSINGFTFDEIGKISKELDINTKDLCINILEISISLFVGYRSGEFKKIYPEKYKKIKEEYLEKQAENIFEEIINEKSVKDHTCNFTYDEIEKYSDKFEINIKDFLGKILGISNYDKWNKSVLKDYSFNSYKYKKAKHERMKIKGDKILKSFIIQRIKRTGTCAFDKKEIEELSKIYKINERDFIVYVLGKDRNTYYDIKNGKTNKCYSKKYMDEKYKILISKKEKFLEDVNPNIRTYYSLQELETLAKNLEISVYDLVVNVMGKSKQNYSRMVKETEKSIRTSIGNHKSGTLPKSYCEKNIGEILNLIKMAVKSAIGYMSSCGYQCSNILDDLIQEGYIYISNYGNPASVTGEFLIKPDDLFKEHSSILYKKIYFNALTNIKILTKGKFVERGYNNRLKVDDNFEDEVVEEETADMFINKISDDNLEKRILKFFSQNSFSDKNIEVVCERFNMSKEELENLFSHFREKILNKQLEIDQK